jgi:hypothetical protein
MLFTYLALHNKEKVRIQKDEHDNQPGQVIRDDHANDGGLSNFQLCCRIRVMPNFQGKRGNHIWGESAEFLW